MIEAYRCSTYGSRQWALRDVETQQPREVPYRFEHPELGPMTTYRGFFTTKREARAAADQANGRSAQNNA